MKMKNEVTKNSNMYEDAKTWNSFQGCEGFNCSYCEPSFKRQAKRQMHHCMKCYAFTPHCHPERLSKIPSKKIVFVAGNGDISFCPPSFTRQIIAAIKKHNVRCSYKTYYFQSKRPEYFEQFLGEFPENVILLTTLETNRDKGYSEVSKAPLPTERYRQFLALDYPRKVVTAEPVMDFDIGIYSKWIIDLNPEYVWIGFNSKKMKTELPEPSKDKLKRLITRLQGAGIEVKGKTLRGVGIH